MAWAVEEECVIEPNDPWGAEHCPNGVTNLLLVGRLARSNSEISHLWEYIRRYMESDPAQPNPLPTPKRVGKFPWPWRSVMAALSLVWPILRIRALYWMIPLLLLISPAVLLFAIGHWISLWLCWEPRWPGAISEACNDSVIDTLKPWLIDIGTWAMGAATFMRWCGIYQRRAGMSYQRHSSATSIIQ